MIVEELSADDRATLVALLRSSSGILFVSRHRDPKFYTARTKRAVNSLTVERGPKNGGGK